MLADQGLCGWRVRSEIVLPELHPWQGDPAAGVDLVIRLGAVPDRLDNPIHVGALLQIGDDGACRHEIEGVATFHLDAAARVITVHPALSATDPAIRAFLFGTTFSLLCYRRGLLPLHAACVKVDGQNGPGVIALAGPSGVGKSTLAAAFRRAGHQVLGDDIAVLRIADDGIVTVLPGLARIKLWGESLHGLDLPSDGLERVTSKLEKFILPLDDAGSDAPLRVRTVVHLGWVNDPRHGEWRTLRGMEAVMQMSGNIYRHRYLARISAPGDSVLARAARAAAGIEQHLRIRRVQDFAGLDDLVARLGGLDARAGV